MKQTITAYPDYYGYKGIGSACSTTMNIYQPYRIDPSASLSGNSENPSTITYTTTGEKNQVQM